MKKLIISALLTVSLASFAAPPAISCKEILANEWAAYPPRPGTKYIEVLAYIEFCKTGRKYETILKELEADQHNWGSSKGCKNSNQINCKGF